MQKCFVLTIGVSVVVFVVSVILHNAVSAILGVEEPVFFVIAVIVAPAAFVLGILGSTVTIVRRLIRTHRD